MNNLSFKHQTQRTATNSAGLTTLYFFDVWEWNVSSPKHRHQDYFLQKFSVSPNAVVVENFPIVGAKVADHCKYLEKVNQEPLVIPSSGRVRVSMAALVKIVCHKYSVLLLQKGTVKPFGGAYYFTELPAIKSLKLDNDKSQDLRFTVDAADIPAVQEWFAAKIGRELGPERELLEELCIENKILLETDLSL